MTLYQTPLTKRHQHVHHIGHHETYQNRRGFPFHRVKLSDFDTFNPNRLELPLVGPPALAWCVVHDHMPQNISLGLLKLSWNTESLVVYHRVENQNIKKHDVKHDAKNSMVFKVSNGSVASDY